MPGQWSIRRDDPEFTFNVLQREGESALPQIRQLVEQVRRLGPCRVDDPNKTRALALVIRNPSTGRENHFFAITTSRHCAVNPKVAQGSFHVFVAIKGGQPGKPPAEGWKQGFGHVKSGGIEYWYYDGMKALHLGEQTAVVLRVVRTARDSFL